MAARDLRYRYFAQLVKDLHAGGICVAHHRDDNVETLLLNLLRGSGVDGLAGIAPKTETFYALFSASADRIYCNT